MSPGEPSSLYLALSLDHQLNHSVGHLLPPSTRPLEPGQNSLRGWDLLFQGCSVWVQGGRKALWEEGQA